MLNDDGNMPLAQTQGDLTPIQRFVYILAKQEHMPDVDEPSGMNKGNELVNNW